MLWKRANRKASVIIPQQNVKDLMLKDEVINAVIEGKFHIYSVSKVEEAIEILTGIKAGSLQKNGSWEPNTIFGVVEKELKLMRKRLRPASEKKDVKKTKRVTKVKSNKGRKK